METHLASATRYSILIQIVFALIGRTTRRYIHASWVKSYVMFRLSKTRTTCLRIIWKANPQHAYMCFFKSLISHDIFSSPIIIHLSWHPYIWRKCTQHFCNFEKRNFIHQFFMGSFLAPYVLFKALRGSSWQAIKLNTPGPPPAAADWFWPKWGGLTNWRRDTLSQPPHSLWSRMHIRWYLGPTWNCSGLSPKNSSLSRKQQQ